MRSAFLPLLVLLLAPARGLAQRSTEVRLGAWRANYSTYASKDDVCEAQPQWLAEELHSVNQLLDAFLAKGSTRNGAWSETDLPLLEQAEQVLPPMVDAQDAALQALAHCELRRTGRFPQLLERGVALVKEAHSEVDRLPELVRFMRHRMALDRWEKERLEQLARAKEGCKDAKAGEPRIYFAWEDELGVSRWLFCDESVVLAPPGKPWEHQPPPGTPHDAKRATMWIQAARLHPEKSLLHAPKP